MSENKPVCCPEHPETELRREYNSEKNEHTLYCSKCPQHHRRCRSVPHMAMCVLLYGHAGQHRDVNGSRWDITMADIDAHNACQIAIAEDARFVDEVEQHLSPSKSTRKPGLLQCYTEGCTNSRPHYTARYCVSCAGENPTGLGGMVEAMGTPADKSPCGLCPEPESEARADADEAARAQHRIVQVVLAEVKEAVAGHKYDDASNAAFRLHQVCETVACVADRPMRDEYDFSAARPHARELLQYGRSAEHSDHTSMEAWRTQVGKQVAAWKQDPGHVKVHAVHAATGEGWTVSPCCSYECRNLRHGPSPLCTSCKAAVLAELQASVPSTPDTDAVPCAPGDHTDLRDASQALLDALEKAPGKGQWPRPELEAGALTVYLDGELIFEGPPPEDGVLDIRRVPVTTRVHGVAGALPLYEAPKRVSQAFPPLHQSTDMLEPRGVLLCGKCEKSVPLPSAVMIRRGCGAPEWYCPSCTTLSVDGEASPALACEVCGKEQAAAQMVAVHVEDTGVVNWRCLGCVPVVLRGRTVPCPGGKPGVLVGTALGAEVATAREMSPNCTCDEPGCGISNNHKLMHCVRRDDPELGAGTPFFYCSAHAPAECFVRDKPAEASAEASAEVQARITWILKYHQEHPEASPETADRAWRIFEHVVEILRKRAQVMPRYEEG